MKLFEILKGKNRYDLINLIEGNNLIGVELGVAGGLFSKKMIDTGKFKTFFGIDKYSDHHDLKQYQHFLFFFLYQNRFWHNIKNFFCYESFLILLGSDLIKSPS